MVQISHPLIAQSFNFLTKKLLLEEAQERYLTADQQKIALLGIRSFFKATASHLKEKLPLGYELLWQLEYLNSTKRHKTIQLSIQNIASVLQPTEVGDEWEVF